MPAGFARRENRPLAFKCFDYMTSEEKEARNMSETPVPQPETQAAETQAADAQMPKTQTVQLWPGMMVEVMTPENRLLYVGRVEKIQNGGVYIREANDDTLPMEIGRAHV